MPVQPLGDLIVTLKLDRAGYDQQIAALVAAPTKALAQSAVVPVVIPRRLREVGTAAEFSQRKLKSLAQQALDGNARFGVMANTVSGTSSALHLLTGQSGFMIVELGRTALYLGRATLAAGGLSAGIHVLITSVRAFLVAIGPVGQIILGLGVAYALFSSLFLDSTDEIKKQADALKEYEKELSRVKRAVRVQEGVFTPAEAKFFELREKFPERSNKEIRKLVEEDRKLRIGASRIEVAVLSGRISKYDNLLDREERSLAIAKDRLELEREISTRFGTGKPSMFVPTTDPRRPFLLLQEKFEKEKEDAKELRFGISSRPAGAFRFGTGPVGSVIGEQSEGAKTNALLKEISERHQRELEEVMRTNRILTGNELPNPVQDVEAFR